MVRFQPQLPAIYNSLWLHCSSVSLANGMLGSLLKPLLFNASHCEVRIFPFFCLPLRKVGMGNGIKRGVVIGPELGGPESWSWDRDLDGCSHLHCRIRSHSEWPRAVVVSSGHPGLSKRPISRGKNLEPNSSHLSYVSPTEQCNIPHPVSQLIKVSHTHYKMVHEVGILLDDSHLLLYQPLLLPHSELLAMKPILTPFGPLDLCVYYDWAGSLSGSHNLRWGRSLECPWWQHRAPRSTSGHSVWA